MQNLAQTIKQQILIQLQALKLAGNITTVYEIDANANPLGINPPDGYPMAVVSMPRVKADFEDNQSNIRTYRFDMLFVLDPQTLKNPGEDVEVLIDAILNQFDSNFTLAGAAQAAVLPLTVESIPVSTGDKTRLCIVVTLEARTLYSI